MEKQIPQWDEIFKKYPHPFLMFFTYARNSSLLSQKQRTIPTGDFIKLLNQTDLAAVIGYLEDFFDENQILISVYPARTPNRIKYFVWKLFETKTEGVGTTREQARMMAIENAFKLMDAHLKQSQKTRAN
jgi:hypothetical protein